MNRKRVHIIGKNLTKEIIHDHRIWWCLTIAFIAVILTNWVFTPQDKTLLYTINEIAKNVGYSLIACVIFFVINDVCNNVVKHIDTYNTLYEELYPLWLKSYQMELYMRGYKYEQDITNEERLKTIFEYLIPNQIKVPLSSYDSMKMMGKTITVRADAMSVIAINGVTLKKDLDNFLEVFGSTITIQEYSKIRRVNIDYAIESANEILLKDGLNEPTRKIDTNWLKFSSIIFPFMQLKDILTEIANHYNNFYYSDKHGIRKDVI